MRETKSNLSNAKFQQQTGDTLTLSGNTIFANIAISETPAVNASTDQVIVRNTGTGALDYVSKANLAHTYDKEIHVDLDNGNNSNAGQRDTPLLTVEQAWTQRLLAPNTRYVIFVHGTNQFPTTITLDGTGSANDNMFTYLVGDAAGTGRWEVGPATLKVLNAGSVTVAGIGFYAALQLQSNTVDTYLQLGTGYYSGSITVIGTPTKVMQLNLYGTRGAFTTFTGDFSNLETYLRDGAHLDLAQNATFKELRFFNGSLVVQGPRSLTVTGTLYLTPSNGIAVENGSTWTINRLENYGGTISKHASGTLNITTYVKFAQVDSKYVAFNPSGSALVSTDVEAAIKEVVSGGLTGATNGLSVVDNAVVLGGILTGNTTIDTAGFGVAIGSGSTATGNNSIAEGCNTQAIGNGSHAEGYGANAIGNNSHAEGDYSYSFGASSHAEGKGSCASGESSHAEGYITYSIGNNSHAEGDVTRTYGNGSHAEGSGTKAFGSSSHAEGSGVCAIGNNSHAQGNGVCAFGVNSHAQGGYTKALGTHSHAEGNHSHACGTASHAEGYYTRAIGNNSHAGGNGYAGGYEIFASGHTSFNHSCNTFLQIAGHGALAAGSAILGGLNHNIESGNTGAAIIGGSTIKLTGTSYIDTTAVAKLGLITVPTVNAGSDQVLVRNTSTGLVDYVSKASIGGGGGLTGATNGLSVVGSDVVLGGTLTGDTCINTINNGIVFGYLSTATGNDSVAFGVLNCSIGLNSFTNGQCNIACGASSHAEGYLSHAYGNTSHSEGNRTSAYGYGTHSGGNGSTGGRQIIGSGCTVFIHSLNTLGQTAGHGANADNSVILGGTNHNIEVGNTGATIIGGSTIKLTGTDYIDTTAVPNLAIMTSPVTGASNQVLARNLSTGKIEVTTAGGGGSATASNGLSINGGGDVVLGGTLTGNTLICGNSYGFAFGIDIPVGKSGCAYITATGDSSFAFGFGTEASGAASFGGGYLSYARGDYSLALGYSSEGFGFASTAIGNGTACGDCSVALGRGAFTAVGALCSVAIGNSATANGVRSVALANSTACGIDSLSHGTTTCALGDRSVAIGTSNTCALGLESVSIGGGNKACADYSSIFGGRTNNIGTGNTCATIVGGANITLTGTSYTGSTVVSKLGIISVPSNNASSDQVLVRNTSTGLVDYVSKASIGGGGGTGATAANNGIVLNGNTVSLGGSLTGNTIIDSSTFGFAIGNGTATATGSDSFAQGNDSTATGTSAIAMGSGARGWGSYSVGLGGFGFGMGNFSVGITGRAYGNSAVAIGLGSCAFGDGSAAIGCLSKVISGTQSFAAGAGIAYGRSSVGIGKLARACGDYSVSIGHLGRICSGATHSAIIGGNESCIIDSKSAVILGGNCVTVTGGSNYDCNTIVSDLAIWNTPSAGGISDVLTWDSTTKKVGKLTQASLGGGSGATAANNGIVLNGNTVSLGGSLTGNTIIDSASFGFAIGNGTATATGSDSFAGGINSSATGDTSFAFGSGACAWGTQAIAFGGGKATAFGATAFHSATASGSRSLAGGSLSCAEGAFSFAHGAGVAAIGNSSHASGCAPNVLNSVFSCGLASFNHSANGGETGCGGIGANADYSAVLGGFYQDIPSGANYSVILGGTNNHVIGEKSAIIGGCHNSNSGNTAVILGGTFISASTVYDSHAIAENFAIWNAPSSGGTDDVLTWNATTKKIGKQTQANVAAASDSRLKTNIEPITNVDLTSIYGVSFEFNEISRQQGDCSYGVIAQDVEKVFPLAVKENYTGTDGNVYKTVNYNQLVPILLEKIKELEERIISLEN